MSENKIEAVEAIDIIIEGHKSTSGKLAKFRYGTNPATGKLYASVSSNGFQHRTVVKSESELDQKLYDKLDKKNENKKNGNTPISVNVDDLKVILGLISSKEQTRLAAALQLQADHYQTLADTVASVN